MASNAGSPSPPARYLCYKNDPLGRGVIAGAPTKPQAQRRKNLGQTAFVRTKAILEIAAERGNFENFGWLLDDYAEALEASLKIRPLEIAERIQQILGRRGGGRRKK